MKNIKRDAQFFEDASAFYDWLAVNHGTAAELWVGFHKRESGIASILYNEAQEVALCFGWVETRTQKLDELRYAIRYTPRKAKGYWSKKNIEKMEQLIADGFALPAGIRAFENRKRGDHEAYSYEAKLKELAPDRLKDLQQNMKAWHTWENMPPSYRRTATHWVESAKQEKTRTRRFQILLESSELGQKIPLLKTSKDA